MNNSGKEFFINNHTIVPLTKPFYQKKWTEFVDADIRKYRIFPEISGDVVTKDRLYYCPKCIKKQFEKHGESYWSRLHQIPGIFVCGIHRSSLVEYPLDMQTIRDIGFILPKSIDIIDPINEFEPDVMKAIT
ncbi:TniQ family protein [Ureibacillus sp. MALMAid1270]|uniref:TniQ family protein n=1 Tax=Ureibacillus sp. MALMAid1270 TaxID=3411629 RepID=UPI003BA721C2